MIKFNFSTQSAIGGRKENQDSEASLMTKYGFLSVVCDGMGGTAGGKIASMMAVDIILREVSISLENTPSQVLVRAIQKANQEIFRKSRQQPELRGMGTTVTAIILGIEKATVAHVGDSRVYLLRDGQIAFRTNDHSKVFELVKRGILNEEQARLSEESNIILRALGIAPEVDVEVNDDIPFLKNDLFMLCTDGICGALPEEVLMKMLKKGKDVKQLAIEISSQIDALGRNQGGGHDNLTLALIQPLINSKLEIKMNKKTKITLGILSCLVALLSVFLAKQYYSNEKQVRTLEQKIGSLKEKIAGLDSCLNAQHQRTGGVVSPNSQTPTTTPQSSPTPPSPKAKPIAKTGTSTSKNKASTAGNEQTSGAVPAESNTQPNQNNEPSLPEDNGKKKNNEEP